METVLEKDSIVLFPEGRLDSSNSEHTEAAIAETLAAHPGARPVLDLGRLEYISSAGLRVLIRLAQKRPGLTVKNVSPEVWEVMQMTGLTSLMDIRKKIRQISADGCERVGRGAFGKVYRIDPDTIVKIYDDTDAEEMIRHEQQMAKYAFLKGLPTAISYDIVQVDGHYGSVFEMVKARTLHDLFLSEPERGEELISEYAALLRRVHRVKASPGDLPGAAQRFLEHLSKVRPFLDGDTADRLKALLADMPRDLGLVHGDLHMKNVMMSDSGPMLIDMDTLCAGDPVFEFAGLVITYELFSEYDPGNSMSFMGLTEERSRHVWRRTLDHYLEFPDRLTVLEAVDRIMAAGYLRFLYLIAVEKYGRPDLTQRRIGLCARRLAELVPHLHTLSLTPLLPDGRAD